MSVDAMGFEDFEVLSGVAFFAKPENFKRL